MPVAGRVVRSLREGILRYLPRSECATAPLACAGGQAVRRLSGVARPSSPRDARSRSVVLRSRDTFFLDLRFLGLVSGHVLRSAPVRGLRRVFYGVAEETWMGIFALDGSSPPFGGARLRDSEEGFSPRARHTYGIL